MGRISGPLMDRFDLRVDVPPVAFTDLGLPATGERSETVAARVATARSLQHDRFANHAGVSLNADASGDLLEMIAQPCAEAKELIQKVAERFRLSARGYHRVLRVARTIADLEGAESLSKTHVAEAISFRLASPVVA